MRKLEWRVVKGVAPHHLGRGLWPRTRAQFPLLPSYFGSLRLQLFEWFHYFWGFLLGLELSSIQFSCSVMSNSSQPHGLQHTRLPCPSPTPGACSDSCPSCWWCHPTISSSAAHFFCLQSFPASGSFPMSQFFASGGQSIRNSASASVFPMNIQGWFPLGLTDLILAVQRTLKSLPQHYSSKT